MPSPSLERSLSSEDVDWDRSISTPQVSTPRNSVVFPSDPHTTPTPQTVEGKTKRTLSDLLKMHAEKGTECLVSPEEAKRVADVLGQWINASSSPYEGEDDFFGKTLDDLYIQSRPQVTTRQRGKSEGGSRSSS